MKVPTPKQADRLRPLAAGYAILAPVRADWVGPLRSGWVERIDTSTPRGGVLPPLRITPDGMAALAAAPTLEGQCTSTTSATTSRPAADSTSRSLCSASTFSGSISPPPASAPRKPSCASRPPSLNSAKLQRLRALVVPASEVFLELDETYRALEDRRLMRRPRRRSYGSATLRCPACKTFVANTRQCSCGYTPGLGWAA